MSDGLGNRMSASNGRKCLGRRCVIAVLCSSALLDRVIDQLTSSGRNCPLSSQSIAPNLPIFFNDDILV